MEVEKISSFLIPLYLRKGNINLTYTRVVFPGSSQQCHIQQVGRILICKTCVTGHRDQRTHGVVSSDGHENKRYRTEAKICCSFSLTLTCSQR